MADEMEFAEGLIVRAPHENAPDFVKANISIKIEGFGPWLREKFRAGEKWVNLDVKVAKSGKWYASVSKKMEKKEPAPRQEPPKQKTGGKFDDMNDDIPFISCSLGDDVTFRKLRWDRE